MKCVARSETLLRSVYHFCILQGIKTRIVGRPGNLWLGRAEIMQSMAGNETMLCFYHPRLAVTSLPLPPSISHSSHTHIPTVGEDHVPTYYYAIFSLWVIFSILSAGYSFAWDIKMDWGLFEGKYITRSERIYSRKVTYYALLVHVREEARPLEHTELASFPGLPRLQFLIACSMQKRSQKPGKAWKRGYTEPQKLLDFGGLATVRSDHTDSCGFQTSG